jgi:hypothetical protein
MSRSQTVSTVSSAEYIIQSLNLSFVHDNLTCVQRREHFSAPYSSLSMAYLRMTAASPRILVLPPYLSTSRGNHEVRCSVLLSHLSLITSHVTYQNVIAHSSILTLARCSTAKSSRVRLFLSWADTQRGVGVAYEHPHAL